ncbi:MAG: hypothetical protein ACI35S_02155 [Anaeroplasma sp.]
MISVEMVNDDNYNQIVSFLSAVPSISELDEQIINNSAIIIEDSKVLGSISFEQYDHQGLIRYFVFKKNMSVDILKKMISVLDERASSKDVDNLICVAENEMVYNIFSELGFDKLDKKIFINEEKVNNTIYKDSEFLIKHVEK